MSDPSPICCSAQSGSHQLRRRHQVQAHRRLRRWEQRRPLPAVGLHDGARPARGHAHLLPRRRRAGQRLEKQFDSRSKLCRPDATSHGPPRRKRLRLVGARAAHGHLAAHLRAQPVRHARRRGREHDCPRRLDRRSRSRGKLGRDARGPDGVADSQRRRGLAAIRTALVSPPRPSPEVDEGAESTLWRTRRGRRSPLGAILEQRRVRLPAISSGGADMTFVTPERVLRVQRLGGDSTAR